MLLATILLILVQAGLGMAVNLYVTIPAQHRGAHPSNFFSGSLSSVGWALAHGPVALAAHVSLGLALIALVTGVAVFSLRRRHGAASTWSSLGGLFVIGAAFNGASFLDFDNNISSLIMAVLAFAAIGCYSAALFAA
jgi:hypothetical protein